MQKCRLYIQYSWLSQSLGSMSAHSINCKFKNMCIGHRKHYVTFHKQLEHPWASQGCSGTNLPCFWEAGGKTLLAQFILGQSCVQILTNICNLVKYMPADFCLSVWDTALCKTQEKKNQGLHTYKVMDCWLGNGLWLSLFIAGICSSKWKHLYQPDTLG